MQIKLMIKQDQPNQKGHDRRVKAPLDLAGGASVWSFQDGEGIMAVALLGLAAVVCKA